MVLLATMSSILVPVTVAKAHKWLICTTIRPSSDHRDANMFACCGVLAAGVPTVGVLVVGVPALVCLVLVWLAVYGLVVRVACC
jgi:hypothetical protein